MNKKVQSKVLFIGKLLSVSLLIALGLQAPAANANYTIAVSVNGVVITTATSSATPANVTVPSDNSIDAADAVRVSLSALTAGSTVSVIANNATVVSALSTVTNPIRSTDGSASVSLNTGTGTTADFYVFTKSTTLSSFTVSSSGVSYTYYLKGSAGPAYNLEVTMATTGYVSSFTKIPLKVTDVFGNPVTGVTPQISAIGMLSTGAAATDTTGASEITVTYPSTAGRAALQISIAATSVIGLPSAKSNYSAFIEVVSLADQIAIEKAALVAEKAARAKDKEEFTSQLAAANKAVSDAQAARDTAEKALATLKSASDAKVAEAEKSIKDLNAQVTTLRTSLQTSQASVLAIDTKYKALIKKYNALAKKYKLPLVRP
jgi:hypothetical protein